MKTTPDKVVRVAKEHVRMYQNRILIKETDGRGAKNINLEECKRYLAIWESIITKGGQNLTPEEVGEISDAYNSGEYDKIFMETN